MCNLIFFAKLNVGKVFSQALKGKWKHQHCQHLCLCRCSPVDTCLWRQRSRCIRLLRRQQVARHEAASRKHWEYVLGRAFGGFSTPRQRLTINIDAGRWHHAIRKNMNIQLATLRRHTPATSRTQISNIISVFSKELEEPHC